MVDSHLQRFQYLIKSGPGIYELILLVFGQFLDPVLNFQGQPSFSDLFCINQFQGSPATKILCTHAGLMFGKASLNIRGDAGV